VNASPNDPNAFDFWGCIELTGCSKRARAGSVVEDGAMRRLITPFTTTKIVALSLGFL